MSTIKSHTILAAALRQQLRRNRKLNVNVPKFDVVWSIFEEFDCIKFTIQIRFAWTKSDISSSSIQLKWFHTIFCERVAFYCRGVCMCVRALILYYVKIHCTHLVWQTVISMPLPNRIGFVVSSITKRNSFYNSFQGWYYSHERRMWTISPSRFDDFNIGFNLWFFVLFRYIMFFFLLFSAGCEN